MKNDICQLQHDLKLQLNRNDILERKKERLQQEIATHKEQRSFYLTERETILCERDQLAQSFEEIRKYNSELQQSRDEAVNKQLEMSKLLGEISFWYSIQLEIYLSLSYCAGTSSKMHYSHEASFSTTSHAYLQNQ